MSERTPLPELTEEHVAQIDRNLGLGFDFLRDVLHRPEITAEIPSGSTLAFHTLTPDDDQHVVRLTAFRPRRSRRWGVRVTGASNQGTLALPTSRWLLAIAPLVEHATWNSSDAAFAAVEASLRRANELHVLAG